MTRYIDNFKQRLIDERFIGATSFVPCSMEEIQAAMDAQHVKRLPQLFIDYLSVMGNRGFSINIHGGANENCKALLTLKERFKKYIEQESKNTENPLDVELPDDAFVFFDYVGILWRWFLTDNDDDNPPIYELNASESEITTFDTMTDYFESLFNQLVHLREWDKKMQALKKAQRNNRR